jgi:hypothetical protein
MFFMPPFHKACFLSTFELRMTGTGTGAISARTSDAEPHLFDPAAGNTVVPSASLSE